MHEHVRGGTVDHDTRKTGTWRFPTFASVAGDIRYSVGGTMYLAEATWGAASAEVRGSEPCHDVGEHLRDIVCVCVCWL